jgi:hypothetical protein
MADRYWLGVSNDFTATANWSTTRNGAGGSAAPTSSDAVYILDGSLDITGNITGVECSAATIGGNFRGNIGTVGTSMTFTTATNGIKVQTCNKQFFNLAATTTIATLYIDGTGNGAVNLTGGTFTNTRCGTVGRVVVAAACTVTNLYSAGIVAQIEAGSAATLLDIQAGVGHELRRSAATLILGGQLTAYLQAALTGTGATASSVIRGGRLLWASNGTIAEIVAKPGAVAMASDVPFTVTNSTVWEGASLFENASIVTFTNDSTPVGKVRS